MIRAANILTDKGLDYNLIIAGYSEDFTKYKKIINGNKNIQTKIYRIPKDELNEIFTTSNYFVAPYREVTQSGPLIISYNYKMIPIASNLEGFQEYIINNETGFLFENENPNSLALCMEKALYLEVSKKNKIYENIKKFKDDEFDIERIAQKYQNFFELL